MHGRLAHYTSKSINQHTLIDLAAAILQHFNQSRVTVASQQELIRTPIRNLITGKRYRGYIIITRLLALGIKENRSQRTT